MEELTSFLRNKWGLNKNREESDRHHALDACVIACTNEYLIQKVTKCYQEQEEEKKFDNKNNDVFPQPWEFFRAEVEIRVSSDNPIQDLEKNPDIFNKINKDLIKPLFVSGAPNRKVSGAIHDETLRRYYPSPEGQNGISTNRKSINNLTLADIENLHDKNRNIKLYNLLKTVLEQKVKFKDNPLYLSEKDRLANRPIKKVTLQKTQKRGFEFTKIKAIADNATQVRVDIFENKGKYYAVPIYLHEITLA